MDNRLDHKIRRILLDALRRSGEGALRRRLAAFLRDAAGALDGRLADEARALRRELGEGA